MDARDIKPRLMVQVLPVETKGRGEEHGTHVGTVDHLEGPSYIKLTARDSVDGKPHWIPIDWVSGVDDKAVYLNKTEEEFMEGLLDRAPDAATLH